MGKLTSNNVSGGKKTLTASEVNAIKDKLKFEIFTKEKLEKFKIKSRKSLAW